MLVDGSNDLAIMHPGVAIPVDAELVSVATNFMDYPILDACLEVDNLRAGLGLVDTERETFMTNRNDFDSTGVKDVSHWDSGSDKKCGMGNYPSRKTKGLYYCASKKS